MKTFICEICGDAYLAEEKPKQCPFCRVGECFIKNGDEANPIINEKFEISDISKKNLKETLNLEINATAVYLCMAEKSDNYELVAMYKRLARVEMEHAVIVTKILNIEKPNSIEGKCSDEDVENFKKTIELEEHASDLYGKFAKESSEKQLRILFTSLMKAETEHIELIKNYL